MCQLIRFPYLQTAHLQSSRFSSRSPQSRLNHRHKHRRRHRLVIFPSNLSGHLMNPAAEWGGSFMSSQYSWRESEREENEQSVLTQTSNSPFVVPNKSCDIWSCVSHMWCRLAQRLGAPSVWQFILAGQTTGRKTPNLETNLLHLLVLVCLQWTGESGGLSVKYVSRCLGLNLAWAC